MPKAGVIRGCIGSASGSVLSELAVAFPTAVLEVLGGTEALLEDCCTVVEGADEVEFLPDVTNDAELED